LEGFKGHLTKIQNNQDEEERDGDWGQTLKKRGGDGWVAVSIGEGDDDTVYLPSSPSPPLLDSLFSLSLLLLQLQSLVGEETIKTSLRSIPSSVLSTLSSTLIKPPTTTTRALQMLFDVHFLQVCLMEDYLLFLFQ